jgi:uncharacterized protein (DUF2141 family)
MIKKAITFYILFAACFLVIFLNTNCANIVAPTGGPRDSLPPVLVEVKPGDSTLNFKTSKITFTFNEYVEVKDIQQNIIVSPIPKRNPEIDYKLRTVTVRIKDTLEENTTYSINFGKAIRDVNEGNPCKNFTYLFSTGNSIDDNSLTGRVELAETGKADSTLVVILHTKLFDSALVNERPRYFTRLDSTGFFRFNNIAAGTYAIYALQDESGMFRYQSKEQLFAFADKPVIVNADTVNRINLYAYKEKEEEKKPVTGGISLKPKSKKEDDKDKRLLFETSLGGGNTQDLLDSFSIKFASPLKIFDSSKFRFTNNKFENINGYSFSKDSLNKTFTIKYNWLAGTAYNIILEKGAAEDSTGKSILRTDTIEIKVKKENEYGSVRLRVNNIDLTKNPVLQLMQGSDVKFSYAFTRNEFYTKLFKPGEYDIRILFDENKNGIWDSGQFFNKHLQPEKVKSINTKLKVKPNWDNEQTINL